uniref:Uncharacterized protein n=1 Tax=Arundo donax TaxID=35708 RepID=A0A0A9GHL3_ARUDO
MPATMLGKKQILSLMILPAAGRALPSARGQGLFIT